MKHMKLVNFIYLGKFCLILGNKLKITEIWAQVDEVDKEARKSGFKSYTRDSKIVSEKGMLLCV